MANVNLLAPSKPVPPGKSLELQILTPVLAIPKSGPSVWTIGGFVFLAVAVIVMFATRGTAAGATLGLSFVSIVLEALPFVMLGSLLGGLFEVFVSREWVVRLLPQRRVYAILVAAGLGLLLPVCECAVIPFTRRLVRKGVPFSTAVAYLLAGPIVNVLVGSATLMAYGWNWHILAARMGFGYFVAVAVAVAMDRWFPAQTALLDPDMNVASACGDDHSHDGHHHGHCDHHHEHAAVDEKDHVRDLATSGNGAEAHVRKVHGGVGKTKSSNLDSSGRCRQSRRGRFFAGWTIPGAWRFRRIDLSDAHPSSHIYDDGSRPGSGDRRHDGIGRRVEPVLRR